MKKLIVVLISALLPISAQGQVYELKRATLVFANGLSFDTLRGDVEVDGVMTISGNNLNQSFTVCLNNSCESEQVTGSITSVGVNSSSVQIRSQNGSVTESILLSINPNIITLTDVGDFVEVDQWVQKSQSLSATSNQVAEDSVAIEGANKDIKFGSAIGEALNALGVSHK